MAAKSLGFHAQVWNVEREDWDTLNEDPLGSTRDCVVYLRDVCGDGQVDARYRVISVTKQLSVVTRTWAMLAEEEPGKEVQEGQPVALPVEELDL